jgi:hypothetical protein
MDDFAGQCVFFSWTDFFDALEMNVPIIQKDTLTGLYFIDEVGIARRKNYMALLDCSWASGHHRLFLEFDQPAVL